MKFFKKLFNRKKKDTSRYYKATAYLMKSNVFVKPVSFLYIAENGEHFNEISFKISLLKSDIAKNATDIVIGHLHQFDSKEAFRHYQATTSDLERQYKEQQQTNLAAMLVVSKKK